MDEILKLAFSIVTAEETAHEIVRSLTDKIITIPNTALRFEVDLSVERRDKSLVEEGLIPANKEFLYLIVMKVGTGKWSMKQVFKNRSTIEYRSDELTDGYVIARRFTDILFTNESQSNVDNPIFIIEFIS